jgi:hypothetical protein
LQKTTLQKGAARDHKIIGIFSKESVAKCNDSHRLFGDEFITCLGIRKKMETHLCMAEASEGKGLMNGVSGWVESIHVKDSHCRAPSISNSENLKNVRNAFCQFNFLITPSELYHKYFQRNHFCIVSLKQNSSNRILVFFNPAKKSYIDL